MVNNQFNEQHPESLGMWLITFSKHWEIKALPRCMQINLQSGNHYSHNSIAHRRACVEKDYPSLRIELEILKYSNLQLFLFKAIRSRSRWCCIFVGTLGSAIFISYSSRNYFDKKYEKNWIIEMEAISFYDTSACSNINSILLVVLIRTKNVLVYQQSCIGLLEPKALPISWKY